MRFRALLLSLLATLLTGAMLGGGAPAAWAHDVLATSDPQDGDVLAAAPGKVTLVYSGAVKTLGAKVVVTGPGGEVQEGAPAVDKQVVTQVLKPGAPAGAYTVTWRVTSSDGHPISGTLRFTVTGGGTGAAGTSPAAGSTTGAPTGTGAGSTTPGAATPAASAPGTAASTPAPTAPADPAAGAGQDRTGRDRTGLWLALGGAALLVAAGAVWLTRRR